MPSRIACRMPATARTSTSFDPARILANDSICQVVRYLSARTPSSGCDMMLSPFPKGVRNVRFTGHARTHHYLRDCTHHFWTTEATGARSLPWQRPRRIQEGDERASEFAGG